jgi:manganese/zinc/iron transport system permease protein
MNSFIPSFDFQRVVVEPWTTDFVSYGWVMLMGFLVATACGLVGNYLILRRMALVGDAISHSVLFGIAVGFIVLVSTAPPSAGTEAVAAHLSKWRSTAMFLGALGAGLLTTLIIELIHKKSRIKQDAAIGITFTTLFALGVVIITNFASKVDLDQECVLYGEIGNISLDTPYVQLGSVIIGPPSLVRMALVTFVVLLLIVVFYKELLVSSFDSGLAFSLGINATFVHYGLMSVLSVVVVSSFESVGAILVIAMLILPGATASLLSQRLSAILCLSVIHAASSSVLGMHLGVWLNCSPAGAMVVIGGILFCVAWIFSPTHGLLSHWLRAKAPVIEPAHIEAEKA